MSNLEADDVRNGTEQAMERLNLSHAERIAWGEYLAVKIAKANLTVHSRMLRDALVKEGIIPDPNPDKEFWLGAVFNNLKAKGVLEKNGTAKYGDAKRNVHERTIATWQLVAKADLSPYREPPAKPGATRE